MDHVCLKHRTLEEFDDDIYKTGIFRRIDEARLLM